MNHKPLVTGIIGAGVISDAYLKNLQKDFREEIELKYISAAHPENARKKTAESGRQRWCMRFGKTGKRRHPPKEPSMFRISLKRWKRALRREDVKKYRDEKSGRLAAFVFLNE